MTSESVWVMSSHAGHGEGFMVLGVHATAEAAMASRPRDSWHQHRDGVWNNWPQDSYGEGHRGEFVTVKRFVVQGAVG